MTRNSSTAILRARANGQITIPAAIRRALRINDSTFLDVRLEEDRIVISRIRRQPDGVFRLLADDLGSSADDEGAGPEPTPLWLDLKLVGNG